MLFFANKKNNKFEWEAPDRFEEYIKALPNCRIKLNIKRYRKPRSLKQNNMWHGMCAIIGREVGMDLPEIKIAIKDKIGFHRDINGLKKYLSSADINSNEFYILTEYTYRIAADMGIILPTPEEWKEMTEEEIDSLIKGE